MEIFRISFFGHRMIDRVREIEETLLPILIEILINKEYVEFYIGRNGEFDEIAASVIKRAQKITDRKNSALILVLPYSVKNMEYYEEYYDEIIIPDILSGVHPKSAITRRNKWMAENSDTVISYIERNEGGAYSAVRYAEKLEKRIINLNNADSREGNFINSDL